MIPYGRQEITQDDIDIVSKVLTSDFLTQGPMVPRFEQSICNFTGAHFATAVDSATSALHLVVPLWACNRGIGCGHRQIHLWRLPIVPYTVARK